MFLAENYTPRNDYDKEHLTIFEIKRILHFEDAQPEVVRLYGDLAYVCKLFQEEKYSQVISEASKLRKQGRLKVAYRTPDLIEESTYFHPQTLRNMIAGFDVASKVISRGDSLQSVVNNAVTYLNQRDAIDSAMRLINYKVPSRVFSSLRRLEPFLNEPDYISKRKFDSIKGLSGCYSDKDNLTVYLQGEGNFAVQIDRSGGSRQLSPKEAGDGFRIYCRSQVIKHSSPSMTVFGVMRWADKYEIEIGTKRFYVTSEEFSSLKRGKALPPSHPLSDFVYKTQESPAVLFSNPMMIKNGQPLKDGDAFVFALQKAYPERPFIRDPMSSRTKDRVVSLNGFSTTNPNVVAIVADGSFVRVTDYRIIQNVKAQLISLGVRVETYNPERASQLNIGKGKAVIVITGHSDAELTKLVRSLGAAGVFDGNYVVFNSCKTMLTRELVTEINTRFGGIATFTHDKVIDATEVEQSVKDLATRLQQSGDSVPFHEILIKSMHRYKLNGGWTVCLNLSDWMGSIKHAHNTTKSRTYA